VILPNVPTERLEALQAEPLLQRFGLAPGNLTRSVVSCTGAQFCNFALIETKEVALAIAARLEQELDTPRPVRFHWTGCPNSCGQPQVADIGLMGAKARKDGKMVPGVDIFLGGRVGHDAHLGEKVMQAVPLDDLPAVLTDILTERFGATARSGG
jgi:ferredoxin-nitrite reductase